MNPDALRYLESLTGKVRTHTAACWSHSFLTPRRVRQVAVVAIAGAYRSGKSFLVNSLCGKGAGFAVGSTVKACTKGIWLWGKAVKVDGADYQYVSLFTLPVCLACRQPQPVPSVSFYTPSSSFPLSQRPLPGHGRPGLHHPWRHV